MYPSEPFPHFVDDYLAYLYETYPGWASLDGIHLHDDLLEDLSRQAIEGHAHVLAGFRRRLGQIGVELLSPAERAEHAMVAANIEARIFDLESARPWDKSPHVYANTIGISLASQTVFGYAPESDRARRVASRLRQVPRVVQAARDNIKDPPGIFVKFGLETWRGTLKFIEADLPRVFAGLDDLHILADLADTSSEAATAVRSYVDYLENDQAPRAKASFRLGQEAFEQKLKLEEGITVGAERLLGIAMRELHETQEAFRSMAGRPQGGDLPAAWEGARQQHAEPDEFLRTAERQLSALEEFLQRQQVVSIAASEPVVVAQTPSWCGSLSASMWTAGPFESKVGKAYYYVADVDRAWAPDQRDHMRDVVLSRMWSSCIHNVYPGHFVHAQHLRRVESKVRKSLFLAPRSFVEGWAHYCEQLMEEVGFGRGDENIRIGQMSGALVCLARLVVGLRLHCEDLSVEQGMRFFRDEAFLEETAARREAERGTFDPGYVTHAAGRLMMLKLRRDYKEQQGGKFSLRSFHDAVLGRGNGPFWLHRRLLLGDQPMTVLE